MIQFVKGIFFDQSNRITKMISDLNSKDISSDIDADFLNKTIEMLTDLYQEIQLLVNSEDLEIDLLAANNIMKYNTLHEKLQTIELFRYLVVINYGEPEEYFKKKIGRIYDEINCLQKQPIITTISNSENYYWALPSYDIIAVPIGEHRNLLNLPDLFHEVGHLIYDQHEYYLKGNIHNTIKTFYDNEIQRVINEQRAGTLIDLFRAKQGYWISSWIMEFVCDFIATYLVGPAYAWTNLKLTTLSSGSNSIYKDSESHPSDEARMRGIFFTLRTLGHSEDANLIEQSWREFLTVTQNPVPQNYSYFFPQSVIEELAQNTIAGCRAIDLRDYNSQLVDFSEPISKLLNDAWNELFRNPETFGHWETGTISKIKTGTASH